MKITIGRYNPATGQVPVLFALGDARHSRSVNACLDAAGKYDRKATAARVDEVARGVAAKLEAGALSPL